MLSRPIKLFLPGIFAMASGLLWPLVSNSDNSQNVTACVQQQDTVSERAYLFNVLAVSGGLMVGMALEGLRPQKAAAS